MNILQWFMAATLLLPIGVASAATSNSADTPITITAASGSGDEEFVGPFPNWKNVKTICGAAGNRTADDTAAIQTCLNALGPANPTLYFPAGTYRITQKLTVSGKAYVNIIGEDPAATTILWAGSAGGTMLAVHGLSYSRVSRLTFDGNNSAAILVDQDWDSVHNYFDTGNEYADNVFKNATLIAFRCGFTAGCAETSMLRDQFIGNLAGAWIGNQNALDLWFWYCTFLNNTYGVSNAYPIIGAGTFHVFNSVFQNSSFSDISYGYFTAATFRNNYSSGSGHFLYGGGGNGVSPVVIQGNTILDTVSTELSLPQAIFNQDAGPVILIDNVIRNSVSQPSGRVVSNGLAVGSLFSMGNTFTASTANCGGAVTLLSPGMCHSINDQVVSRSTVNPAQPILPSTPPNNGRTIFEVPTGSSATTIQAAINNAVAAGSRSVVHLQSGAYTIGTTITTPANADIQIIGDGGNTVLGWNGGAGGPLLKLNEPSKVVLRDFRLNAKIADGIEINTADLPGSRVFMQTALVSNTTKAGIFADTLDHTLVEMHDTQIITNNTASTAAVKVVGGPSTASGTWLGGATNIFTGLAGAANVTTFDVSAGAHVYVGAVWYEDQGTQSNYRYLSATGPASSAVSIVGAPMHLSTTPAISFSAFLGKAAVVGTPLGAGNVSTVGISGTATEAQNLGLGLSGSNPPFFIDTSSGSTTRFLNGFDNTGMPTGGPTLVPETSADPTFLASVLTQMRSTQPSVPTALPAGVTDVRMYRVTVETGVNNIHIKKN